MPVVVLYKLYACPAWDLLVLLPSAFHVLGETSGQS